MDQTHAHVEPAPHGVLEHLVERRPLIPPLGAADAGVLVRVDDLPAAMSSDLGERQTLILSGLAVRGADPKVECRPHVHTQKILRRTYHAYTGVKCLLHRLVAVLAVAKTAGSGRLRAVGFSA